MSSTQKKIQEAVRPFEGKTVLRIDTGSCNMWTIHFTDGTFLSLETEHFGHSIYGIVPNVKEQVGQYAAVA